MRRYLVSLLPLLLLAPLAGCRGSQVYTQQDLRQVKQSWAAILPTYIGVKRAFHADNGRDMVPLYRQGEKECHVVDEIDTRDTIDPNVRLFQASVILDDFCDAIDSAYLVWAKRHHKPYPKDIPPPANAAEIFGELKKAQKDMRRYLSNPSKLA